MASKTTSPKTGNPRVRKTAVADAHRAAVRKAEPLPHTLPEAGEPPQKKRTKRPTKGQIAPYALPETGDVMIPDLKVAAALDEGASTVWYRVQTDPTFPRPIKLGPRCTRFSAAALREWIAKKAAESAANAQPSETVLKAGQKSVEKRRAARAAAAADAAA